MHTLLYFKELFIFDDRGKGNGTRGHSTQLGAHGAVEDTFFLIDLRKGGTSWTRRQSMRPASTRLKVN